MRYVLLGIFLIFVRTDAAFGNNSEPYVCLEVSSDLPACNFHRTQRDTVESEYNEMEKFKNAQKISVQDPAVKTIIYKLEGCRPSRLPFVLPNCKTEDSVNRIVEVRRIFPFTITGESGEPLEAPLIFPEVETGKWLKFMADIDRRPSNPSNTGSDSEETASSAESISRLTRKRKNLFAEKPGEQLRKHQNALYFSTTETSIIFPGFPLNQGNIPHQDSYKSKHHRRHNQLEMKDTIKQSRLNSILEFPHNSMPNNFEKEFPYDPATLRMLLYRSGRTIKMENHLRPHFEFPHSQAETYGPEKELHLAKLTQRGSEFPYSQAIPFDPVKHRNLLHQIDNNFDLGQLIRRDNEFRNTNDQLRDNLLNDFESSSRLRVAREIQHDAVPEIFPYEKAVPFNSMQFRRLKTIIDDPKAEKNKSIKKRDVIEFGSEFPYFKALPYNHRKVSEFRRRLESQSKSGSNKRSTYDSRN